MMIITTFGRTNHGGGAKSPKSHLKASAHWIDIVCLTILSSTTLGAITWQFLLVDGFAAGVIDLFLGALAYVFVLSCLAELASAIPFSGGTYGFVRVTMGRRWSLVVGLAEAMQYVLRGGYLCAYGSNVIIDTAHIVPSCRFLVYIAMYTLITINESLVGHHLWKRIRLSAFLAFGLLLFWIFKCVESGQMDLWENGRRVMEGGTEKTWLGDEDAFIEIIRYSVWLFMGAEMVPLAAEDTLDPRRDIPKGMFRGVSLSILMAFITLIVGSSMPPGIEKLVESHYPLTPAMHAAYHSTSPAWTLLTLPGIIVTLQATTFAYGRVFYSLSRAGLIPDIFTRTAAGSGVPYAGLVLGGSIGLVVALIILADGTELHGFFHVLIFDMSLICAFIHMVFIFVAYVLFKKKCPNVPRYFHSPWGQTGVVLGMLILLAAFSACWIASKYFWVALLCCGLCFAIGASYYALYARHNVRLCPEEAFALSTRVTAERMLTTGIGFDFLYKQCEREYSTENITCWQAIANYHKEPAVEGFREIYETYLTPNSDQMANVPATVFADAEQAMERIKLTVNEVLAHQAKGAHGHRDRDSRDRSEGRDRSDSEATSDVDVGSDGLRLSDPSPKRTSDPSPKPNSSSSGGRASSIHLTDAGSRSLESDSGAATDGDGITKDESLPGSKPSTPKGSRSREASELDLDDRPLRSGLSSKSQLSSCDSPLPPDDTTRLKLEERTSSINDQLLPPDTPVPLTSNEDASPSTATSPLPTGERTSSERRSSGNSSVSPAPPPATSPSRDSNDSNRASSSSAVKAKVLEGLMHLRQTAAAATDNAANAAANANLALPITLSSTNGHRVWLAKRYYNAPVKAALAEGTEVLERVQKEVLFLLEKDTLPRFKQSPLFLQYVEAEPLLFQGGGR